MLPLLCFVSFTLLRTSAFSSENKLLSWVVFEVGFLEKMVLRFIYFYIVTTYLFFYWLYPERVSYGSVADHPLTAPYHSLDLSSYFTFFSDTFRVRPLTTIFRIFFIWTSKSLKFNIFSFKSFLDNVKHLTVHKLNFCGIFFK